MVLIMGTQVIVVELLYCISIILCISLIHLINACFVK